MSFKLLCWCNNWAEFIFKAHCFVNSDILNDVIVLATCKNNKKKREIVWILHHGHILKKMKYSQ